MRSAVYESELKKICGDKNVRTAEPMSAHTTFRTGGPADFFVTPKDRDTFLLLLEFIRQTDRDYFILGRGSNILVGDKGYRGTVIDMSYGLTGVGIKGETVEAEAGAGLGQAANMAAKASLSGMEFASGIPGTVGGAVYMNAGAYGGEMSQIVTFAEVVDTAGQIKIKKGSDMDFGYRTSLAQKEDLVVISVKLQLHKGDREEITARIKDLGIQRAQKQPLEYASAGSTFKRPEGDFAGRLISEAGLSGLTVGGACVSPKHNGFIINMGNATSEEILKLIEEVKNRVKAGTGVELSPEVRIIGEF